MAWDSSQRHGPRPDALKMRLAFATEREFVERFGQNVTATGLFVRSRDPRPLGTRLSFEITLRGGEAALSGSGVVRYVRAAGTGADPAGMGLEVGELGVESQRLVAAIVAERAAGRLAAPVPGASAEDWPPLVVTAPPAEEPNAGRSAAASPVLKARSLEPLAPEAGEATPLMMASLGLRPAPSPVQPEPVEKTERLFGPLAATLKRASPASGDDRRLARAPSRAPPVMTPASATPTPAPSMAAPVIGLELDWGSVRAAVREDRRACLVPLEEGGAMPACVAEDGGGLVYGRAAEEALAAGAPGARGLFSLLGAWPKTRAIDPFERRELTHAVAAAGGMAGLLLAGRVRSGSALVESLLREVRARASEALGVEVTRAALALPSAVSAVARKELREAARRAGLVVERTVPSPLALAAGRREKRLLVLDLEEGGIEAAVVESGSLVATASAPEVGGVDVDLGLVAALLSDFEERAEVAVPEDAALFHRVRQAAAVARTQLSKALETEVVVPDLMTTGLAKAELRERLTRARLHAIAAPVIERAARLVQEVLGGLGWGSGEVDALLLGGAAGRWPVVAHLLGQRLAMDVTAVPESAALGAALLGDGPRPGGAAALGATVWARLEGASPRRLVERGTPLPAERTYAALQVRPADREISLQLLQGDRGRPEDNDFLGVARAGPLPAGRGTVQVTFTIVLDAAGELAVGARETSTGRLVPVRFEAQPPPSA